MRNILRFRKLLVTSFILSAIVGCGGGGGGGGGGTPAPQCTSSPCNVTISWSANNGSQVNMAGGGHRVYRSMTSGFAIGDTGVQVVNVPYVSGATAPASIPLSLTSGTHYIRVVAYTAFPNANTNSNAGAQRSIVVP